MALPPEPKYASIPSITLGGTAWPNVTLIRSAYYADPDTIALAANTEDGEPLAAFSVNLHGNPPAHGAIWVKTWSEGEGVAEQLVALGIIELTGRKAAAGYSLAVEAKLIGELAVEPECEHKNVTWLSGVEGVVVALNGDVAARCDDCGLEATMDQMEEAADALPF
jgi:hypothetical protein